MRIILQENKETDCIFCDKLFRSYRNHFHFAEAVSVRGMGSCEDPFSFCQRPLTRKYLSIS